MQRGCDNPSVSIPCASSSFPFEADCGRRCWPLASLSGSIDIPKVEFLGAGLFLEFKDFIEYRSEYSDSFCEKFTLFHVKDRKNEWY